jgi:hypothetical protein
MALVGSLWFDLFDGGYLLSSPLMLLAAAFQLWMLVDALRRGEWLWALSIFFFSVFSALLYFFMVYRQQGPVGGGLGGFELPGAGQRRRVKELQGRIYHLDHARDHLDLADIHFADGKLAKAEAGYRESLKRDASDVDAIAHLGQCLLRQKRPLEAKPLLEQALAQDPKHDYGHTLMALAEVHMALGEVDAALGVWRQVLSQHSYARAKVQYAEMLEARGEREAARREVQEVVSDDAHSPKFQRQRDRVWIKRAKRLLAATTG